MSPQPQGSHGARRGRDAPSLDRVFQALADPGRRRMVDRLGRGPASVSELARPLEVSLPAVLQHLKVLEASGLVKSEKVGRVRSCALRPEKLRAAERWMAERRTAWEARLDPLGEILAGDDVEPESASEADGADPELDSDSDDISSP